MAGEGSDSYEIFRLSGWLSMAPTDIAIALRDARLSDSLLLDITDFVYSQAGRAWHQDYIYMRRSVMNGEGKPISNNIILRVAEKALQEEEEEADVHASALLYGTTWRKIDNGPRDDQQERAIYLQRGCPALKVPAYVAFDQSEMLPREILRCIRTLKTSPSLPVDELQPSDIAAGGQLSLHYETDFVKLQRLVQDIVQSPDCLLDGLSLPITSQLAPSFESQLPYLCQKLTHLQLLLPNVDDEIDADTNDLIMGAVVQALMQESSCKLTQLGMWAMDVRKLAASQALLHCHLSRLDLRGCSNLIGPDWEDVALAAARTSISDLGIHITNARQLKQLANSAWFPRLLILRLSFAIKVESEFAEALAATTINEEEEEEEKLEKEEEEEDQKEVSAAEIKYEEEEEEEKLEASTKAEIEEEAWEEKEKEQHWMGGAVEALAEALTKRECNIRFLDLFWWRPSDDDEQKLLGRTFWHSLQVNNSGREANLAVQALRILPSSQVQVAGEGCLAHYLSSQQCSLLWLQCRAASNIFPNEAFTKDEEWELANSLAKNFSLCTLSLLPNWKNAAAEARANSYIKRNLNYKTGQLLQLHEPAQVQVEPSAARLFLCGHEHAGKTTLCRMLLRSARSPLALAAATCGLQFKKPSRTRGMEFHSLHFKQGKQKLVVCDLGGQEEYHAFHHFFMNASHKDLFIVVCKHYKGMRQKQFESKLQYWLRFIVAHKRPSALIKPKVVVLVNFFDPATLEEMASASFDMTYRLMETFSEVLDFGPKQRQSRAVEQYDNLFGIAANKAPQVKAVNKKLGVLLDTLLQNGDLIPQLCIDISQKVLPSLAKETMPPACLSYHTKPLLFLPYKRILEKYCEMNSLDSRDQEFHKRVRAALIELHYQGMLVFFPEEDVNGSTMVIIDIGWFCNKLIGNLLGVHLEQRGSIGSTRQRGALLKIEDINGMLRLQGVKDEHLEEIIRYLQKLDLCFYFEEDSTSRLVQKGNMLLFPALLEEREVKYPQVGCSTDGDKFYGRRLQCKESSLHLIPSGVFTKLQVRLHKLCDDNCYDLGYCWATLKKGIVGAVVRFGGDVVRFGGDVVNEPWENKQWLDIVVLCNHEEQSQVEAESLMKEIKALIYDICQSTNFSGIPEVLLEECVLGPEKPGPLAYPLVELKEKLRREGLERCHVNWGDVAQQSTHAVELLLPSELREYVNSKISALATIKAEFSTGLYDDDEEQENQHAKRFGKAPHQAPDESDIVEIDEGVLTGEYLQLFRLVKKVLERHDRRQGQRFEALGQEIHNINWILQLIRKDIRSLDQCLRQAERDIITNCSTRLLRHELTKDRAHPIHPYLVDAESRKLAALKNLFRKKACLHFMCESPIGGPHPVEGQKGKEIVVEVSQWLTRSARVMVPAFKVLCCLARIAATMFAPGSQVLIPSDPGFLLQGLGRISEEALQQHIFSEALKAFLDGMPDEDYKQLLEDHKKGSLLLKQNEVKEALQLLLKNVSIDMHSDFGLERVCFNEGTLQEAVYWVCDQHMAEGSRVLEPIPNPFALS